MTLTRDNVRKIRAIFDDSDCAQMSIESGGLKLDMRKPGDPANVGHARQPQDRQASPRAAKNSGGGTAAAAAPAQSAASRQAAMTGAGASRTVKFMDTTLRDAHQSLWATRMTTAMMLPIAERLDQAGFDAIDLMGLIQFDVAVRYLKEDPWERVRLMRRKITRTPMQASVRSRSLTGFDVDHLLAWVWSSSAADLGYWMRG